MTAAERAELNREFWRNSGRIDEIQSRTSWHLVWWRIPLFCLVGFWLVPMLLVRAEKLIKRNGWLLSRLYPE